MAGLPRTGAGNGATQRAFKRQLNKVYAWYTGGFKEPSVTNSVLLAYGDGRTFTTPEVMAGPRDGARARPAARRPRSRSTRASRHS